MSTDRSPTALHARLEQVRIEETQRAARATANVGKPLQSVGSAQHLSMFLREKLKGTSNNGWHLLTLADRIEYAIVNETGVALNVNMPPAHGATTLVNGMLSWLSELALPYVVGYVGETATHAYRATRSGRGLGRLRVMQSIALWPGREGRGERFNILILDNFSAPLAREGCAPGVLSDPDAAWLRRELASVVPGGLVLSFDSVCGPGTISALLDADHPNVEKVVFPARFDPTHPQRSMLDLRHDEGLPLWPAVWPADRLSEMKVNVGLEAWDRSWMFRETATEAR